MIQLLMVNGSVQTTYHDFTVTESGMTITLSPGSYYRAGQLVYSTQTPSTVTLTADPSSETYVDLWITTSGLQVVQNTLANVEQNQIPPADRIDRIGWLKLPAGTSSLDSIEIDVIQINEG